MVGNNTVLSLDTSGIVPRFAGGKALEVVGDVGKTCCLGSSERGLGCSLKCLSSAPFRERLFVGAGSGELMESAPGWAIEPFGKVKAANLEKLLVILLFLSFSPARP